MIYSLLIYGVHPVGVRIGDIVRVAGVGDSVRVLFLLPPQVNHRLRERSRRPDIFGGLVDYRHIVGVVGDDLELACRLVDGHHPVVGDAEPALSALASGLGGDEHDSVRSPVSVNRAGGGVLEYGHAEDVVRVHVGNRALEAVNDDERARSVKSPDAPDADGDVLRAGLAGSLTDLHAGAHALKHLGGGSHRTGLDLVGVID